MSANRVELEGVLTEPVKFRTAPSGTRVASLELEHRSPGDPNSPVPLYHLAITVVAVGELGERFAQLETGSSLKVSGQLNQRRWIRDGQTRFGKMELMARQIEVMGQDD